MKEEKILIELNKAIDDIYEQGYILGFGTDKNKWKEIYTKAVIAIFNGAEFSDKLLFECDESIPANNNHLH